jgi:hypothetical protein
MTDAAREAEEQRLMDRYHVLHRDVDGRIVWSARALARLVQEEAVKTWENIDAIVPGTTDRGGEYGAGWNGAVAVIRARLDSLRALSASPAGEGSPDA